VSPEKGEAYLRYLLAKSTDPWAFIGIRGSRKTWGATTILERLRMMGKKVLIIDYKGDDETRHLKPPKYMPDKLLKLEDGRVVEPRPVKQSVLLKEAGLKARGWKVKYLTFYAPFAMGKYLPRIFEMAPIPLDFMTPSAFKHVEGFFTRSEARAFQDAYYDAGGKWEATVQKVIKNFLRELNPKRSKTPARMLAMLTSGFFCDPGESPISPPNLIEALNEYDFVVLSIAHFSGDEDIGRFGLYLTLWNLLSYLRDNSVSINLIVHLRELTAIAPRAWAVGQEFHLRKLFADLLALFRQTKTAYTTFTYEVQSVKNIPQMILDNTFAVFVSPINLLDETEAGRIKQSFKQAFDSEVQKKLDYYVGLVQRGQMKEERLYEMLKGRWFFLTKSGFRFFVKNIEVPQSCMIPEAREEAEAWAKWFEEKVPSIDLEPLGKQGIKLYRIWKGRWKAGLLDEERETEYGFIELSLPRKEEVEKAPPYFKLLCTALRRLIPQDADGLMSFSVVEVKDEARKIDPEKAWYLLRLRNIRGLSNPKQKKRTRILAEKMGITIGTTPEGNQAILVRCAIYNKVWEEYGEVLRYEPKQLDFTQSDG